MRLPQFTCDIPLEGKLLEAFACVLSYPASNTCVAALEPVHADKDGNIIVAGQTVDFARDLIRMVQEHKKPCMEFYSYEFPYNDIAYLLEVVKDSRLHLTMVKHRKNITQYIVCPWKWNRTPDLLNWVGDQSFWVRHIMFGLIFGYDVFHIRRHLLLLESFERYKKHGLAPINNEWFTYNL